GRRIAPRETCDRLDGNSGVATFPNDSPKQEDTLALLDHSLKLFAASLQRPQKGKRTHEHQPERSHRGTSAGAAAATSGPAFAVKLPRSNVRHNTDDRARRSARNLECLAKRLDEVAFENHPSCAFQAQLSPPD